MSFNPEGSTAQQLKGPLMAELRGKYGIEDDAEDVADFIMVSIGNNVAPDEIVREVVGLVDCNMDAGFIGSVLGEIARLESGGSNGASGTVQTPSSATSKPDFPPVAGQTPGSNQTTHQHQPPSVFATQTQSNFTPTAQTFTPTAPSFTPTQQQTFTPPAPLAFAQQVQQNSQNQPQVQIQVPETGSFHPMLNFPSGPKGSKKPSGAGGIGKHTGGSQKKLFGVRNAANLERALAHGNVNKSQLVNKPKGRCPDFPYCSNKDCELAHPTKTCYAYPNCLNAPGTCNFLHPGEDQELMAKLEQLKREYQEKRAVERAQKAAEASAAILPCKYGKRCTKEACIFGHPTPANEVPQQITQNEWCVWGRQCTDPNCAKAHPLPIFDAAAAAAAKAANTPQPSLEQCKFGSGCTNFKCTKRHATTPVKCREGANCVRIDCFFSHPIAEDCRFGANCTNKVCMFRHPEGRKVLETNTWRKEDAGNMGRAFAVPEDEVMEQAVQN